MRVVRSVGVVPETGLTFRYMLFASVRNMRIDVAYDILRGFKAEDYADNGKDVTVLSLSLFPGGFVVYLKCPGLGCRVSTGLSTVIVHGRRVV